MDISLREINSKNRAECIVLKVASAQAEYIATNEQSLRDAEENDTVAQTFAIYSGDAMVGFAMIAWDEENDDPDDKYWLWRFMIDEGMQRKGYGYMALEQIIEYFRVHGADVITLSTKASNLQALRLYHKFGFLENGQMNGEEIILKLRL